MSKQLVLTFTYIYIIHFSELDAWSNQVSQPRLTDGIVSFNVFKSVCWFCKFKWIIIMHVS